MTPLCNISTDYTAILLTGISGCGKSTVASEILEKFSDIRIIDGDEIRAVTKNFRFGENGRMNNCIAAGKLLSDHNNHALPVLCMESPKVEMRETIYENAPDHRVLTIHLDVTKDTASSRDPKGLYMAEAAGELERPMVGDNYERGDDIDITIDNNDRSISEVSEYILSVINHLLINTGV
jgi:adenylylsulfate kinase-like enzyme